MTKNAWIIVKNVQPVSQKQTGILSLLTNKILVYKHVRLRKLNAKSAFNNANLINLAYKNNPIWQDKSNMNIHVSPIALTNALILVTNVSLAFGTFAGGRLILILMIFLVSISVRMILLSVCSALKDVRFSVTYFSSGLKVLINLNVSVMVSANSIMTAARIQMIAR